MYVCIYYVYDELRQIDDFDYSKEKKGYKEKKK